MNQLKSKFRKRLGKVVRALLVTGLMIPAMSSHAAKLVVMEVRGTAFKVGESIDGAQSLTLKEGERLVAIGPDGKTVQRRGPFSGALVTAGSVGTDPKLALTALVASRDARTSSIGVVRSGAASVKLPTPWLIDITRSGQRCLRDGEPPVMWRPVTGQAMPFVVFPADRSWRADFKWDPNESEMQMPALSRFQGITTMLVNIDQQEFALSFSAIPKEIDDPIVLAAWMLEKGCIQQADALLDILRSSAQSDGKR